MWWWLRLSNGDWGMWGIHDGNWGYVRVYVRVILAQHLEKPPLLNLIHEHF